MVFSKVKHLLLILIILSGIKIHAQKADSEVLAAFVNSYEAENSKKFKAAANALQSVYDTDNYEINLRLGWLEYNAGMLDKSYKHYLRASVLKPYSVEAMFGMIYPLSAQGKWTEVIGVYGKILTIDPKNTYANYRLGYIYYNYKDYNTALYYFLKVAELYPFDYDANAMCGWSYYMLGKTREAKIFFTKALRYNPESKEVKDVLQKM